MSRFVTTDDLNEAVMYLQSDADTLGDAHPTAESLLKVAAFLNREIARRYTAQAKRRPLLLSVAVRDLEDPSL